MAYHAYLTKCSKCGSTTSIKYAREHNAQCKACFTGEHTRPITSNRLSRNERLLEHGYEAYSREEGIDGNGDCPY